MPESSPEQTTFAQKLRRNGPALIAIIGGAAACCVALAVNHPEPAGPGGFGAVALQTVHKIAQAFVLNLASEELMDDWWGRIGGLLILGLTGVAVFTILGKLFEGFRLYWWARLGGRHVVICGLGRVGRQLAYDYLHQRASENLRVVVIEPDEENDFTSSCREMGAVILTGEANDPGMLERAQVHRARRIFIVTGDDGTNIETALQVLKQFKTHLPSVPSVSPGQAFDSGEVASCHLRLSDHYRAEVFNINRVFADQEHRLRVEVFNQFEATARHLFRTGLAAHPPGKDQVAHYLLLGFGEMGQAIALQIARQAHFSNLRRPRMTICDPEIEKRQRDFLGCYPAFAPAPGTLNFNAAPAGVDDWAFHDPQLRPIGAGQVDEEYWEKAIEYVCNAEFLPLQPDLNDPCFMDCVDKRVADEKSVPTVVICFDNDSQNLEFAVRLSRRFEEANQWIPIHVWLPRFQGVAELLRKSGSDEIAGTAESYIRPFGEPEAAYSQRQLMRPYLEELAAAAHESYRRHRLAEGADPSRPELRPWRTLDGAFKDSNRQQADHLDIKLRAAGYCRLPGKAQGAPIPLTDPCQIMALMEHNRFVAERLMGGWKYGPEKNLARKQNPSLVPYGALHLGEKEKDDQAVEQILQLLELAGDHLGRLAPAGRSPNPNEKAP